MSSPPRIHAADPITPVGGGALRRIRILKAIRLAPADLEAFIVARRVGMKT